MRHVFVAVVLSCAAGVCFGEGEFDLSKLRKDRPRLMLTDERLSELKETAKNDEALAKCVKDAISSADSYCKKDKLVYKKIGPRLLSVSRDCMNRMYALGVAWRWTGDNKYADNAVENLLAVCEFDDWNPSHFLDTAEMSHAVGVGYDWFYDYFDDATREKIKAGLIKNGMEEGLKAYAGKGYWFTNSAFNWNQVCNGGLVAGALAIADSDPKYAEVIVPGAVKSFPKAIKSYAPDGAWGEGIGYWEYATQYTAYGICAMQTALGDDFGLLDIEGFSEAGYFPIYMAGPTDLYFNFADVGERSRRRPISCMFWLAEQFDNQAFADSEHEQISRHRASAEHVMWYVPKSKTPKPKELDRMFRGHVDTAVLRSGWDDKDAIFVGIKAGYNQVNHGHLDLGSFEMDALGVRWARDLGSEDYNLPGYWSGGKGGKRWSYYRLNSESHNVPLLGGRGQDEYAKSKITRFETAEKSALAAVDLTEAYKDFSTKTVREVSLVEGRSAVLVKDEFSIIEACDILWGMTTDADIEVKDDGSGELTLNGKRLVAKVLSPAGVKFSVGSAERQAPERTNKGIKRLLVEIENASGDVTLSVLLLPAD